MWVNSKEAAKILGVKYDTLQKSINRASKQNKKICFIECNKLLFKYINGVGRGGKVLQIWIDSSKGDETFNKIDAKQCSLNNHPNLEPTKANIQALNLDDKNLLCSAKNGVNGGVGGVENKGVNGCLNGCVDSHIVNGGVTQNGLRITKNGVSDVTTSVFCIPFCVCL